MKNLKNPAIIAVMVMNTVGLVLSFGYYKQSFEDLDNITNTIRSFFLLLTNFLELTLGFIALLAAHATLRDKAYRLLRFVYVMYYLLYFPVTLYFLFTYSVNFSSWQGIYSILARLASLGCVIVFLAVKPERHIGRIDLRDYELVSYTSGGHRFVHYLLDLLFLFPFMFSMVAYTELRSLGYELTIIANILYYGAYFIYSFFSEAIFRQTFGKIATNSCVVSNGIPLTTGRIFIRTLCRYIPFDAFSFLWGGNWHDSVSSTAVVYVDSWEKVFNETDPESEQKDWLTQSVNT